MWSDPIDEALANARSMLTRIRDGLAYSPDELACAIDVVKRGIEARKVEHQNDRLLTPQDRY